jgi:hypothetical protein
MKSTFAGGGMSELWQSIERRREGSLCSVHVEKEKCMRRATDIGRAKNSAMDRADNDLG